MLYTGFYNIHRLVMFQPSTLSNSNSIKMLSSRPIKPVLEHYREDAPTE